MKTKSFNQLIIAAIFFYLSFFDIKQVVAQSSCQQSVNAVIKSIQSKGVSKVNIYVNPIEHLSWWQLREPAGQYILGIAMVDIPKTSDQRASNIINSKILTKNWALSIFRTCNEVGYIAFNKDFGGDADGGISFAMTKNEKLLWRRCSDNPNDLINSDSEPIAGDEMSAPCAWVPVDF